MLQDALKNSQIDCLTSLHQPSSLVNKEVAFYDADYGCAAIGDTLSLYYSKLVQTGMISMSELIKLAVANPAKSIGKKMGTIEVGQEVSAVLFYQNARTIVNNSQSLYNSEELSGKVAMSFEGKKVTRF